MKQIKPTTRRSIAFYLMIAPWLLVFLSFSLFPLVYGFYLSFTNYFGFNLEDLSLVGLKNYQNVFSDKDAMGALGRTFLFAVINVPLGTVIALSLALLLNHNIRGRGVFRTIFYIPSIMPAIVTTMMWKNILFTGNGGILDRIIGVFGLGPVNWLGYDYALFSLILMSSWGAGGGILIYLAGLKGVPDELYESAAIDGASYMQRLFRITLPLLTPVIFFNVLMGIIGTLQQYLQPILLAGDQLLARPIKPIYLYVVHAFQQIFANQRFAYGMALLWVLFIITLLLTLVVFKTSRLWVFYEDGGD
ncbi:MAG: sugar ABC transporter permease [Bacillota bacterium]|nr:sugar ABC transporter permease [Bacillota bacterium]